MRADQLPLTEHLFVCAGGAMLPAWQEAFPGARAVAIGQLGAVTGSDAVLWLRLDEGMALAASVAKLHAQYGPLPVVVLSDTPNDTEALAALSAQARGYCNSHAGAQVLAKVASVVTQGGLWIGETLMHRILSVQHLIQVPASAALPDWRERVTAREAEVAELAAKGLRYKEIARELSITERTVKAHIGAILEKLDLRDRLQLALLVGERQQHNQL